MATCRAIITSALRKLGKVHEGQPAPTAYDADIALEVLQGWYEGAMAAGLFGQLTEVNIEADYEAKEFERIVNISGSAVAITLPGTLTDTETGEVRTPLDLVPVVVIDPGVDPINYIYDAIVGDWVSLTALEPDDVAPLSQRGSDGLACLLAVQMAEEYGWQVGPITMGRASRFLTTINQRNGSPRRVVHYDYY